MEKSFLETTPIPKLMRKYAVPCVVSLLVAALYLGQQVYDIVFVHDNVANFMHIVGGICGTGFGYFYALRPQKRRRASGAKPGLKFEKTSRHRSR